MEKKTGETLEMDGKTITSLFLNAIVQRGLLEVRQVRWIHNYVASRNLKVDESKIRNLVEVHLIHS